jgi:hypothetical protein
VHLAQALVLPEEEMARACLAQAMKTHYVPAGARITACGYHLAPHLLTSSVLSQVECRNCKKEVKRICAIMKGRHARVIAGVSA